MEYKRILTIQDLSCVGKCSSTVALPILSVCGHETCVLPTALLSTHTGGFGEPVVRHLWKAMPEICRHWMDQGIRFDAVLVGYLGSCEAIKNVASLVDFVLKPGGILIVDPAMADHGRVYSGLDDAYVRHMSSLCSRADVILPNLTEAALLSGSAYRECWGQEDLYALLKSLDHNGVILTGVRAEPEQTGAAVYCCGDLHFCLHNCVQGSCHGTGDIFAAVFTGMYLRGKTVVEAAQIAGCFTMRCMQATPSGCDKRYGVRFESVLPELTAYF